MPVSFIYIQRGNRVGKLNKDKELWEQTANNNKSTKQYNDTTILPKS